MEKHKTGLEESNQAELQKKLEEVDAKCQENIAKVKESMIKEKDGLQSKLTTLITEQDDSSAVKKIEENNKAETYDEIIERQQEQMKERIRMQQIIPVYQMMQADEGKFMGDPKLGRSWRGVLKVCAPGYETKFGQHFLCDEHENRTNVLK